MTLSSTKVSTVLRTLGILTSPTNSVLPNIPSLLKPSLTCLVTRNYAAATPASSAAPAKGKGATSIGGKIKEYPVETDPHKLVNYCCGLNYIQDSEEVKLKPDNEYPDWLYELYIGKAKSLNEMDPNTKEYWMRVRYLAIRRNVRLHRFKTKVLRQFK